jgi:hypothetical protein
VYGGQITTNTPTRGTSTAAGRYSLGIEKLVRTAPIAALDITEEVSQCNNNPAGCFVSVVRGSSISLLLRRLVQENEIKELRTTLIYIYDGWMPVNKPAMMRDDYECVYDDDSMIY